MNFKQREEEEEDSRGWVVKQTSSHLTIDAWWISKWPATHLSDNHLRGSSLSSLSSFSSFSSLSYLSSLSSVWQSFERIIVIFILVDVLANVLTASMLDEYLNGDAGESNPNMRDDEYLKCPPSHILFHHHYVTELTTAPHHSQMLNNHNLAFSPLQLTHNQTLQSSDLTRFFQPWQVFISTAEQNEPITPWITSLVSS